MLDLATKGVPHPHYCTGCDRQWPCHNATCSDITPLWCRKWCPTCPPELEQLEHVQKAGHDLHLVAFGLDLRGEHDLVRAVMTLREQVLARSRQIGEEIARAHSLPATS